MNKKGFTLIELITTIALLAVIAIIAFVSVNAIIKESKKNNCDNLIANIKTAASEYVSDNRYNKEFINNINNNQMTTDVAMLMNNSYLKGDIVNPYTNEVIDPSELSIIIFLNRDYTMSYAHIEDTNSHLAECNLNNTPNNTQSEYTITYDANGGTGAPTPDTYTYSKNEAIYLSSTIPSKSGNTFLGWSANKKAQKETYKAGDPYPRSISHDITLYAIYRCTNCWILTNNVTPLINQKWQFYRNSTLVTSGLIYTGASSVNPDADSNNKNYYYLENGYMVVGWKKIDNKCYFFRNDDGDNNSYIDGYMLQNTTKQINGINYTFDESGVCTSGNCNC